MHAKQWQRQEISRQIGENDFITFLGSRYAPVGADNDPHNLNAHWVRNVKFFYNQFTGGS